MSDTGGENLTLMLKVFAFPYSRSLVLCLVELEKVFFYAVYLNRFFQKLDYSQNLCISPTPGFR